MKKRIVIITGIMVIACLFLFGYFIFMTEPGLQFVLSRIIRALPGLTVESAQGRLAGPLNISKLHYSSPGFNFEMKHLGLDWRPSALLSMTLRINSVDAEAIRILTSPGEGQEEDTVEEGGISIPLRVEIEDARLREITVMSAGAEPFWIHEIVLRADVYQMSAEIHLLKVESPTLSFSAAGDFQMGGVRPLDVKMQWEIYRERGETIKGEGKVSGTMQELEIMQESFSPFRAHLQAAVRDIKSNMKYQASLSLPEMVPSELNPGWPDVPLSGHLQGSGTAGGFLAETFIVRLPQGEIRGSGKAVWDPQTEWTVSLSAEDINPGLILADWTGDVSLDISASGSMESGKQRMQADVSRVRGTLRAYPVSGSIKAEMEGDQYVFRQLDLHSGSSHITATGSLTDTWNLKWKIHAPDIAHILPGSAGSVKAGGFIKGPRSTPNIHAVINGRNIVKDSYRAGEINADVSLTLQGDSPSSIKISGRNISAGDENIHMISLDSSGTRSSHHAILNAESERADVMLAIEGSYTEDEWKGMITRADLFSPDFGTWALNKNGKISVSSARAQAGSLCWMNDGSTLCLDAEWIKDAYLKGSVFLSALPLQLFRPLTGEDATIEGTLSGKADIIIEGEDLVRGEARLETASASVSVNAGNDRMIVFPFMASLDVHAGEKEAEAALRSTISDSGNLRAHIKLPPLLLSADVPNMEIHEGSLDAELFNLGFLSVILPDAEEVSGALKAGMKISGNVAAPIVQGGISLENGSAEIGRLGIRIEDTFIKLETRGTGEPEFKGKTSSGEGSVEISGNYRISPADNRELNISLNGKDFEALNIPDIRMIVSPALDVRVREDITDFKGELYIPSAVIEPPDLEGAVKPSGDVVIVSREQQQDPEPASKLRGSLKVILGEDVRFDGFGLKCNIKGSMTAVEEPGKDTTATGELRIVKGTYRAYGQNLEIERGRLLFIGGPVDNPGLDIQAVRQAGDVTAGVRVRGTLKSPEMILFSEPPMDQSDALSYLVLGRPLDKASSSEGNLLINAAASAGLSGGEYIAKKIGARFGLEDVTIKKGDTYEEASLFIGKYLSPRLYIGYGIGMFEPVNTVIVRYRLTNRWLVQGEHGLESGGDLLFEMER